MLIAASVLWSLSGLAVKIAAINPAAFAFWRALAAAVTMLLVAPFAKGSMPSKRWLPASIGFYSLAVGMSIVAMTYATAAKGILLQYTGPAFCALFAWMFQGRSIGRRTLVALLIASAGILIMVLGGDSDTSAVGSVCGLISGLGFAGLILVLEKINRLADNRLNPFALVSINSFGAAGLILLAGAMMGFDFVVPTRALLIVIATGVVQLAAPYALFQMALKRVSPVDAALLVLLEPVLNPVWVWLAIRETPDTATLLGGAAILVSLVIEATKKTSENGNVSV